MLERIIDIKYLKWTSLMKELGFMGEIVQWLARVYWVHDYINLNPLYHISVL